MSSINCPECGHVPGGANACPHCGHALTNGARPHEEAAIPAEVSGWTKYETPPGILEQARQTFDEKEYLAGVTEIERTGGVRFEEFIGEVEERVGRRE